MTDPAATPRRRRQLVATPATPEQSAPAPTAPSWVRRLGVIAVGALVVLAAAEVGVRVIADDLPLPLDWHTAEAERKVERMDELAADGGTDVVLLGTSIVNGLDPARMTDAAGDPLSVYNASLTAGLPPLMEAWFRDAVVPRLRPKLVVIGVSSFDISDEPPERGAFFDAFRRSPAAERASGSATRLTRADHWMAEHSDLWRYRSSLRHPGVVLDTLRGDAEVVPPYVADLQPSGRTTFLEASRFEDRDVNAGGTPLSNWSLGTKDRAALVRLIQLARGTGADVVLVDMPVTDEYVLKHPNGAADYDTYLRSLRALGDELQVPVIELSSIHDHTFFADEVHLNVVGAAFVTQALQAVLEDEGLLP